MSKVKRLLAVCGLLACAVAPQAGAVTQPPVPFNMHTDFVGKQ